MRSCRSPSVSVAASLIVLATIAAYANTFSFPFFFDDIAAIEENATIRHLSRLGDVLSPPSNGSAVTGRPIVNLSLALNYAVGGTSPAGYHAVNLALHAAAALAFFGLVRRTLILPVFATKFGAHALPLAFVTALLWTLHPLQTESVTCIAQRTELLVGLFYLLTFYTFVRGVGRATPGLWVALSITACFLGMASKEVMVSAPLLVLLFDRTFVAGSFLGAWHRRRILYLGLAASWLLLAALVAGSGGSRGAAAGFGLGVTWWSYSLTQCEAIILYLRLCFWPSPLVLDYGTAVVRDPLQVLPQACLLIALVATAVSALWRRPWLGFIGLWFFSILAPSSSVVPLVAQTMAEHRMYLPLAAVAMLFVIGLHTLIGRCAFSLTIAVALVLGTVSFLRNRDYQSEIAIWSVTVAQRPDNARAHYNLGVALLKASAPGEALTHLVEAVRLQPDYPDARQNLATVLLMLGRAQEAIPVYKQVLAHSPHAADAHSNLGLALLQAARVDESIAHGREAVRLMPASAGVHLNLANALAVGGQTDAAIAHFREALRLRPGYPEAQANLSQLIDPR